MSEISVRVCDIVRKGGKILEGIAPDMGRPKKSESVELVSLNGHTPIWLFS